jgi:hypothetical protein
MVREAKNYERGLKMVPFLIHLPPPGDDIDTGGRDERDITDEALSQAQDVQHHLEYCNKGFKTKVYGQRHIAFEIIASKGLGSLLRCSATCADRCVQQRYRQRILPLDSRRLKNTTCLARLARLVGLSGVN